MASSRYKISPESGRKHALCCFGGGLRAMTGESAIISAGIAAALLRKAKDEKKEDEDLNPLEIALGVCVDFFYQPRAEFA